MIFYEHNFDDSIKTSLVKNVLNLGNECRALAQENARLKAEVEAQAKRWAESEDLISHYKQQMDEAINDCQCSRLKAEVERLTKELSNISGWGRGLESDLSHARVEISFLKAEVGRLRLIAYDEKQHNANLRAEVERLTDENVTLRMERMQDETGKRITYADYASLKAEVERLKEGNDCLGQMHDKEMERSAYLLEEFNRTTAWGRGLESDLSHARVEISFLKAEVERLNNLIISGGAVNPDASVYIE